MFGTCGRCVASAIQLTSRQHRVLSNHTLIFAQTSLKGSSIYGLHALDYSIGHISCRRHASSASDKKKNPSAVKTASSSNPTSSLTNNVNPPLTTLPADLDLPNNTSSSSEHITKKVSRYISIGRAYLGFYKTGLKNVYLNYKSCLPIRRELGLSSYIPTSPPTSPRTPSSGATSLSTALETLHITRAEYQLVRRATYDVHRIIPFGLLLLICGEFTPLIVVAIGDAVTPYTCRVPKQIEKTRAKRLQLKKAAFAAVQGGLGSMKPVPTGSAEEMTWLAEQFGSIEFVTRASAEQVIRASRLRKWNEYLALDDGLIVKGGGVGALSAREIRLAIDERGGVGVGADARSEEVREKEERKWLIEWLKRRSFV
ncbi:conserved hypothetical protein [Talaromyces stipitatus ATCC 10500]|uniref:Letm1 RBD domain-containing protein n=1 Tax=Talaromyces stipitatus (strain ATCC 10500 / CBS 375.48 / QM 6759 / NRRL 1006) TaxID=441959 RepID=B8MNN9_TALSN|nr:uncharacterized protein TSTA_103500 [Talaromyces stipitatus ATCC 10500]EED14128.1 conserved hypothetical protein [Talaromyces stipitatus ATCC 10500]